MNLHTVSLNEAEAQLQAIVKQTRATHQPIVIIDGENNSPIAMVMEAGLHSIQSSDPTAELSNHLSKLEQILNLLSLQWEMRA